MLAGGHSGRTGDGPSSCTVDEMIFDLQFKTPGGFDMTKDLAVKSVSLDPAADELA
jgi:hypothetical protein